MSTALTICGWFAQAFIKNVFDDCNSYVLPLLSPKRSDLAEALGKLSSSLRRARDFLCRAGRRWTAEHHELARLETQLKCAVYDAEDLLGDLRYEILKQKIESGEAGDSSTFSSSFPADFSKFCNVDFVSGVREVAGRLDETAKKLQELLDSEPGKMLTVERARETSHYKVPRLFGREGEREAIVRSLLSGSGGANLPVLPVVGMVGVGKTALAQYVYEDPKVGEHFNLKMWVSVSRSFEVRQLTKQIIESPTGKVQDDLSLASLQEILQKKVMEQKFLLVLDDVRKEADLQEWKTLFAPLRHGRQGSMILVTTPSERIANIMRTMEPVRLKGLSDDECWKLLKSHAFGLEHLPVSSELEVAGRGITAELKGSPSAAISLASRLKGKTDAGEWREIMKREMWESQQDGIMEPLRSSYHYLPGHLMQCFSIFSVFPKRHPFNQRELVGVWAAQGFITTQKDTQMEVVGAGYLDDLVCRFFFERTWSDHHWQYVIPDLMHVLAHLVSKDECFMLRDKCRYRMPPTVRHLSVCAENLEPTKLKGLGRYTKLRSLLIFEETIPKLIDTVEHWFNQFKHIRLLNLSSCQISELPDSIRNLKHLRYLDISRTGIERLPETLCLLYNLQLLNIWECPLGSFPKDFTKLIKLRYLHVEENMFSKIPHIGRLTSLQELQQFQVQQKDGHGIGELKDLWQLRKRLHIKNLENVESNKVACEAKLNDKKYVDELFLEWSPGRSNFALDMEVLEGLQPHQNLEQLEIKHYGGERSPSWMHQNLYISKLHIENCPNLKEILCLPPILTELRLVDLGLDALPRLWDEGSSGEGTSSQGGNSSSLSKLHVERFPRLTSLEQWLLPHRFPVIKSIQIIDCEKLMSLPVESFNSFAKLEDWNISNCPKLNCTGQLVSPLSIEGFMPDACGDLSDSLPTCLESLHLSQS